MLVSLLVAVLALALILWIASALIPDPAVARVIQVVAVVAFAIYLIRLLL